MYCKNCGAEMKAGARFCAVCGKEAVVSHIPEQEKEKEQKGGKKKKGKGKILCIAAVIFVLTAVLVLQNFSILPLLPFGRTAGSDTGYKEPEKVAEAFVQAIANKDFDKALSLFGNYHMAENYDISTYVDQMGVWNPGLTEYPTEEKFFEEAALENQKSASAKQITHFCFSFQADEKYLNNMPISVSSESEAKDLASDLKSACDMDEMETLELKRMEYAKPEVQKKAIKEDWRYKIYDADEIAEYAVLYEYNGDTYCGGMTLLRYDEKWYILNLRGDYSGISSTGYVEPASEEEYLQMAGIEE